MLGIAEASDCNCLYHQVFIEIVKILYFWDLCCMVDSSKWS